MAEEDGVASCRDAMFVLENINGTENRAVLHTARRSSSALPLLVDGENIRPKVMEIFQKIESFAQGIRSGRIRSSSRVSFNDVPKFGIGGSDFGPEMATLALNSS